MNENKMIDNPRIKIVKCVGAKAQDEKMRWNTIKTYDSLLWLKGYFTKKISPLTDFCVHDRTWNLFALVVV